MSPIICDSSSLIILAKLDRLALISKMLRGDIHVTQCVADEVVANPCDPLESSRLETFLKKTKIVKTKLKSQSTFALSPCDLATLEWAIHHRAGWMLVDERLLRRVAMDSGIRVVGCLGLLVIAAHQGSITKNDARHAIDSAVNNHGCRISVQLYQRIMRELEP